MQILEIKQLIYLVNEIASFLAKTTNFLAKLKALALIEALSFYGGVRHKRLNGEQEIAPNEK
ncbi:hypothetical protein ACEN2I_08875 [Flavobacterium sp. W22_SRS_FK3]|uniref:hypothetical protein n=1 Tax=Flavobacterium sp. W22_SRS_FK3 TaxID=3240275 RepID=UPI003F9090CC